MSSSFVPTSSRASAAALLQTTTAAWSLFVIKPHEGVVLGPTRTAARHRLMCRIRCGCLRALAMFTRIKHFKDVLFVRDFKTQVGSLARRNVTAVVARL
jgi:hypothetical protein